MEREDRVVLFKLEPQDDLPPGPTLQCSACGTRLRPGQPHTAALPVPHATYKMLIVEAPEGYVP